MKKQILFTTITLLIFLTTTSAFAKKNNLHLIDEDRETGFAIYRTSQPSMKHMKQFCNIGIDEMVVLSGTAEEYEYKNQAGCPTLRVVYNEQQSARVAIKKSFLDWFDNWVAEAKRTGKKIAFRCSCGCHRTGRLAAYYQMKYQGLSADDSKAIMKKHGKYMWLFRTLKPQVVAMKDFLNNEPCSQKKKYCVKEDL